MAARGSDRAAAGRTEAGAAAGRGWSIAALAALWLPFFGKLAPAWSASVELAHGWAVPVLAAFCAWERARLAGPAAVAGPVGARPGRPGGAALALAGGFVALALALTVLAANPLWPMAQWAGYAAVAGLTVLLLARAGGAQMVRRFWFPLFFVSTALSWPTALTLRLQAALVGLNTEIAAWVVSTAGYPAVVTGNVIEVATGFVGVDEACSGVRSWQAAWMTGWFLGELGGLGAGRRGLLVAGALGAAVLGNLLRTTGLTWLAATRGPAASALWHDRAGTMEMVAVLAAVAWLAWRLSRGAKAPGRAPAAAQPWMRRPAMAVLAVGVLAAAVPEGWYGWHEARAGGERVQWRLQPSDASWRAIELPAATRQMLRASREEVFERREVETGGTARALLVRWDGDATLAAFAEAHGPTVCLPAAGVGLVPAASPLTVQIAGVTVQFQVGRFEAEGRTQHVMYCQWDAWLGRARSPRPETMEDVTGWRWARVREGRRRGDAAYVVFVVPRAEEPEARAWVAAWAPRLLRRE